MNCKNIVEKMFILEDTPALFVSHSFKDNVNIKFLAEIFSYTYN